MAVDPDVLDYVEQRQAYNMHGGGAVDISSMSLPAQMFTYLFRPLPFEAHSLTSLAVSIENVALLVFFLAAITSVVKKGRFVSGVDWVFCTVYAVSAWVLLASTTANLGISVRQKWMFLPMLILTAISVL